MKQWIAELLVYWFPSLRNAGTSGDNEERLPEKLPRGRCIRYLVQVFEPGDPWALYFFPLQNSDGWVMVWEHIDGTISHARTTEKQLPKSVKELLE